MIKIPGYYELQQKLSHWKKKYKEDIYKLQNQIKRDTKIIEVLKIQNGNLKSKEMYQTWLKERKKLIAQLKLNNKLLDEIDKLKKEK